MLKKKVLKARQIDFDVSEQLTVDHNSSLLIRSF